MRDSHTALDIVQDAMLKLAEKYGTRPAIELPPVFQRIMQNAIRDHFRRTRVRSFWTSPLSVLRPSGTQDDDSDPLESFAVDSGATTAATLPPAAFEQADRQMGLHHSAVPPAGRLEPAPGPAQPEIVVPLTSPHREAGR